MPADESSLPSSPTTRIGLVILTTGDRPAELDAVLRTTAAHPFDERLLVGNGTPPPQPAGWRTVEAPENLGVPGGRSFGMAHTTSDVVVFLDDDSVLSDRSDELVAEVRSIFDADSTIGALAFRVVVTGTDETMRRWSPTPLRAVRTELGDVPTFPGNGHALRRAAFEDVGGYLDELFFKHEETELTWRLLDSGWRVVHDPGIVVEHPKTAEARHERALELGIRNKIWIARLRLPIPVASIGGLVSAARAFARCRSTVDLRAVAAGLRAGVGPLPVARRPISWATVARLTKAGRPPIF